MCFIIWCELNGDNLVWVEWWVMVVGYNFICFVIVFYLFFYGCLSCFLLYLYMFVFCLFYGFDIFGVMKIIVEGNLYCVSCLLLMYWICYFGFLFLFLIWLYCYFILWIFYILNFVFIFNFVCFCLIISGDISLNFGLFIMFFIINCWVV